MSQRDGLRRSPLAPMIELMARSASLRRRALRLAFRAEGDMYWSATARAIMQRHHGVTIGAYSYGDCFTPGVFPRGTVIGRYASIASGIRVFARNHPMQRLSLHPFFYNAHLGFVERDTIESGTLEIGHEAWIGDRAIFTPGCRRVGISAVVGAGAVVTKDVADFAIVAGNPARELKRRFDPATIERLLASRWWERPLSELLPHLNDLIGPLERMGPAHPLLQART
jgi:virginiamycin A acetyltransferase